MPIERKPLFRPDVMHQHLVAFQLPERIQTFRPKLTGPTWDYVVDTAQAKHDYEIALEVQAVSWGTADAAAYQAKLTAAEDAYAAAEVLALADERLDRAEADLQYAQQSTAADVLEVSQRQAALVFYVQTSSADYQTLQNDLADGERDYFEDEATSFDAAVDALNALTNVPWADAAAAASQAWADLVTAIEDAMVTQTAGVSGSLEGATDQPRWPTRRRPTRTRQRRPPRPWPRPRRPWSGPRTRRWRSWPCWPPASTCRICRRNRWTGLAAARCWRRRWIIRASSLPRRTTGRRTLGPWIRCSSGPMQGMDFRRWVGAWPRCMPSRCLRRTCCGNTCCGRCRRRWPGARRLRQRPGGGPGGSRAVGHGPFDRPQSRSDAPAERFGRPDFAHGDATGAGDPGSRRRPIPAADEECPRSGRRAGEDDLVAGRPQDDSASGMALSPR